MMTVYAALTILGLVVVGAVVAAGLLRHRSRMRYNEKLETAFNRARYTRECAGR